MVRPIAAVVAGVVLWGVVWAGTHAVLVGISPESFDADGFTQSAGLLLGYLALSVVLSTLAGYVAARIAGSMRTVLVLAAIQLLIGILVQVGAWERMPIWYHIPFLLMVVPAHVLGGWMRLERKQVATA